MTSTTQQKDRPDRFRQLGDAYFTSVGQFWTLSWEIGSEYLERLFDRNGSKSTTSRGGGGYLNRHYLNYAMQMAAVPWIAAERFIREYRRPASDIEEPPSYGTDENSITPPVEIADAGQGYILYSVSRKFIQSHLESTRAPFNAVDLGSDQTPLVIFIVDHRESDLGSYYELEIASVVRPKNQPFSFPGVFSLNLAVSEALSMEAGNHIWGYGKYLAEETFESKDDSVLFTITTLPDKSPLMSLSIPRGGRGASKAIPIYTYTAKDGKPTQTIFTRSGDGESVQFGGRDVRLTLGDKADYGEDELWKLLNGLDLLKKRPILCGWTEHMSATIGIPITIE